MTPRQSGSREEMINLPKMYFGSLSLFATAEESDAGTSKLPEDFWLPLLA